MKMYRLALWDQSLGVQGDERVLVNRRILRHNTEGFVMREILIVLIYVGGPIVITIAMLVGFYRVFKARQRFDQWVKNATKSELFNAQVGRMEFIVYAAGSLFSIRACFSVQAPNAIDDFGFFPQQKEVSLLLGKMSCETPDALAEFVLITLEEFDCDMSNNWGRIGGLCFNRLRSSESQRAKFYAISRKSPSGKIELNLISNQVIFG